MQVASDVTQLIGNTPMVYLNRIGKGLPGRVAAKVRGRERKVRGRT
jgi:cysteine synthase